MSLTAIYRRQTRLDTSETFLGRCKCPLLRSTNGNVEPKKGSCEVPINGFLRPRTI